jgi:hypothetical protein
MLRLAASPACAAPSTRKQHSQRKSSLGPKAALCSSVADGVGGRQQDRGRADSVLPLRDSSQMTKIVFVLGAGASVADVATKAMKAQPPLDRGFFRLTLKASPGDLRVREVQKYFERNYALDICATDHDSVEGVMSRLYPDMFNTLLEDEAQSAFRALLRVFTDHLATTTNAIRPTRQRLFYRMLSRLLADGVDPSDITVVTFNQDLQVEKVLEHLSAARRWSAIADQIFCFPELYSVAPGSWDGITGPSKGASSRDLFVRTSHDAIASDSSSFMAP